MPYGQADQTQYLVAGTRIANRQAVAIINASGTLATLIPAVPGKSIVVVAAFFSTDDNAVVSNTVRFFSGDATDLSGPLAITRRAPLALPYNPVGWLKTAAGEALKVTIATGSTSLSGTMIYVLE